MRKIKHITSLEVKRITLVRRPNYPKQGDRFGRQWYHNFKWADRLFDRAPNLLRTIKFNLTE